MMFEIESGLGDKMRLFKTLLIAIAMTMMVASSASALITVTATTAVAAPLDVGDTFDVDILLTWDGAGAVTGIFSSHQWSNTQLSLLGASITLGPNTFETRPVPLKSAESYAPALTRFGTIASGLLGDDLSSTARTVQYGAVPIGVPLNPATSQRTDELITTLTFEVIGVGDGVAEIAGVFLQADECQGDTCVFGPDVVVNLPEPGSVLLAVFSLVGVFGVVAVRRRRALA
jgi:hypothetical protein